MLMTINKELNIINITKEQVANIADLQKALLAIEDSLNSYIFIDTPKCVAKLSVSLVANPPETGAKPEYQNKSFKIVEYNKPKILDGKQVIQNKQLINSFKKLEMLLINIKEFSCFNIIILYDRSYNDVIIKGFKDIPAYSYSKNMILRDKEMDNNTKAEAAGCFISTTPKYTFEQVILNDDLKLEIDRTLTILNKRQMIYETWDFKSVDATPRAILNFFGPSGTGKTMAAHAVAHKLGCNILAVNYAEIESKYVGDAPKNLFNVFEQAAKDAALLFFDEADSFLGKRITDVSSSSDQSINSLRSQMLILLENFEGIVVFATNLLKNYDKAFESRIFKHLEFALPCNDNREKIISKSIPLKVPFSDISNPLEAKELTMLAELSKGFSGRYIKNSILGALTNALLDEREFVLFSDLTTSFLNTKNTLATLEKERGEISAAKKKELGNKIRAQLHDAEVVPMNSYSNQNTQE
jgi:AAA+ superfamily predicted ATPase